MESAEQMNQTECTDRFDLLSADLEQVEQFVTQTLGQPRFRARQIYEWMMRGVPFAEMSNLPLSLRQALEQRAVLHIPRIVRKQVSAADGTVKYLFSLYDGENVESVFMRYHHGNTLCVSTQAGCNMGCTFCASAIGGKVRNLLPAEMLGQVIAAQRDTQERVGGIVLMGIGEPLDNYDNVIRFLRLVSHADGLNIGLRHISLSTCGLVPGIEKLAQEGLPVTLSVSLHAPTDEQRSAIMPVNRKWNLQALMQATVHYFEKTGRRVSFEYTLIRGQNDTPESARALVQLFRTQVGRAMPLHVNLIPLNPVAERGGRPSGEDSIRAFCTYLEKNGITATVRRRLGADIDASCGQLRNRQHQQKMMQSHLT